jgi:hypothetical protein
VILLRVNCELLIVKADDNYYFLIGSTLINVLHENYNDDNCAADVDCFSIKIIC